jgi:hypothetical protein
MCIYVYSNIRIYTCVYICICTLHIDDKKSDNDEVEYVYRHTYYTYVYNSKFEVPELL